MSYPTLLDAARGMEPSRERGIIEIYARENQVLASTPVLPINRASYVWKVEDALPYTTSATGTRAVNADFTASNGRAKSYEAKCKIYGGKIQVDRYISHNYPESVADDETLQIKALSRQLFIDIFEGTGAQYLTGLGTYSGYTGYTGQVVNAGATTTPVVITCDALDELISKVDVIPGRTFLYMNDAPYRKIMKDNRGGVSGGFNVQYTADQIGFFAGMYNNIPIIKMQDGKGADLLSITEADYSGGSSNSQSVYCVTWGAGACQLFSSNSAGIPGIVPKSDGSNFEYEVLEWFVGLAPRKPRSFGRLKYVKNALS